jgi:hypothetical protein
VSQSGTSQKSEMRAYASATLPPRSKMERRLIRNGTSADPVAPQLHKSFRNFGNSVWPGGCYWHGCAFRQRGPENIVGGRDAERSDSYMLKTEIKTAIDQHSRSVRGVRHQLKLQWAALEPRWSSRAARYLLAIEVFSDPRPGPSTMHVVTRAGTSRTDLLRLVDDALEDYLRRERPATVTAYPCERTASEDCLAD